MTRDDFIEVLVESKSSVIKKILKYALYALTALFVMGSLVVGLLSFFLAIICGIAGYFVSLYSQIEYEYSYMNKEIDVDIIYNKQKRKHIETYDLSKMEVLAPIHSYHLDEYKNRNYKVCDYSSKFEDKMDKRYVLYYGGEKKIIFEPTMEMVEAIMYMAPRKVFRD